MYRVTEKTLFVQHSGWPLSPPWRFAALLPMLSVTHIMPVLALLSVAGVGMQQCMIRNRNEMHKLSKVKNRQKYARFLPRTLSKIPDISVTTVKFPDISRQVVTLSIKHRKAPHTFFSGACWQQPYNADNKCTAAGVTLHQFDALCTANVKVFMQSEWARWHDISQQLSIDQPNLWMNKMRFLR